MFALIMAGGSGTRLWPVSRKNNPKQLLKLVDDKTLLQTTFQRLTKGFSNKQIFIATTAQHSPSIARQLPSIPKSHYSIEPVLRDRGPAIALAALLIHHHNPKGCFVTAWSDHYIKDETAYFGALKSAENFLKKNPEYFLTIGVKPTYAHTGFGYIEQDKNIGKDIFKVKSFKEKPDFKTATKFVKNGKFYWNTGYFVCRADTILELYRKHQPEIYNILLKIKPLIGTAKQQSAINRFYPAMPHIDIEKGLIEKLDKIAMVPAKFDWADIGSWKIIKDVLSHEDNNLILGKVLAHNTKRSLIYNYEDKLVAVADAEDLIIINTKDALLIANKHDSEQVKELVKKIQSDEKLKKYL